MKRTLKRGLKVREIAEREAIGPNATGVDSRKARDAGCQHQFCARDTACEEVLLRQV